MKKNRNKISFRITICVALILAYIVSKFYFQFMLIQGDSMLPTYNNMQLVLLDKHSKYYEPGEVVAFQCDNLSAILVKRIVAGPGDTIQIIDTTLYVNGIPSHFYEENIFSYAGFIEVPLLLDTDQWFVIGDNIDKSKDSRYQEVGVIYTDSIIGKVVSFKY